MSGKLLLVLVTLCLLAFGLDHVTSSQEKGDCSNPEHAAPLSTHPHSQGSWLIKQLTEGDARLKEQLKEGDSNVKELLREGDANLKELLVEGVTRLKEQQEEDTGRMKELVNEEYGRLKRRLVEDVERLKKDLEEGVAKLREERKEGDDWLRDQITRAETHLTEELTRELTQAKKQLQEQHEAIEDLRKFMTDMTKRNQAAMEQLTEKMTTLTEKLQTSDIKMAEVTDKVSAVEDRLQSREDEVSGQLQSLRTQVETARGGLDSQQVTATHTGHITSQLAQLSSAANATGSTFVRWGRTTCPNSTVMVYSGVAGGGHYSHSGTGANRLCLTLQPQFDNTSMPANRDWLYGAEYDGIPGHVNWDVPCALCRAPQPTTIMVPATLTCPPGWALQYTGHLAGHLYSMAASTEFVCLDALVEHRPGSSNDQNGDLFHYTLTACGSLPCPPYIKHRVVTCVVCSL